MKYISCGNYSRYANETQAPALLDRKAEVCVGAFGL